MPLTNCPVCSNQVSTAAIACPHCGHPLSDAQRRPSEDASPPPIHRSRFIREAVPNYPIGRLLLIGFMAFICMIGVLASPSVLVKGGFSAAVVVLILLGRLLLLHVRQERTDIASYSDADLKHKRDEVIERKKRFRRRVFQFAGTIVAFVVIFVVASIALRPDEKRLRSEVFGTYGRGLEEAVAISESLGGPKLRYIDQHFYSVLLIDHGQDSSPEFLAIGAYGHVWLTADVKRTQDVFAPLHTNN